MRKHLTEQKQKLEFFNLNGFWMNFIWIQNSFSSAHMFLTFKNRKNELESAGPKNGGCRRRFAETVLTGACSAK